MASAHVRFFLCPKIKQILAQNNSLNKSACWTLLFSKEKKSLLQQLMQPDKAEIFYWSVIADLPADSIVANEEDTILFQSDRK